MENNEITMIAAARRTGIERSRTNFGWYVNMQDSGYTWQALSQPKELTDCDRIEKTFSELGNAGFVLFEHTLAPDPGKFTVRNRRGLKQAHPVKQGAS